MIPTFFGLLIVVIGLVLLVRGDVMSTLSLMMICSLFGGSAAVILTALGGSSIPPSQFALLFAVLRIALPGSGQAPALREGIRANVFLLFYVAYGLFAAFLLSRVFAGMIQVFPLRVTQASKFLFDTVPLKFSPQNITVSVYMIGTAVASIMAYVAMQGRDAAIRFVRTGLVVAWIHLFFGISAAVLKGTLYDAFIDLVRNANYAQLDQSVGGYVRITGVMPEPSSYASFAFTWLVFMTECWLRSIEGRKTGLTALALTLVLLLSTSSTAYAALAVYASVLIARFLVFPASLGFQRFATLVLALFVAVMAIALLLVVQPQIAETAWRILLIMTVEKQDSLSGLQRAFWAKIGLDAFVVSYGLGIGPGSFRSSSIATAVIGSVGVVGVVALLAHMVRAFKPLRASTFSGEDGRERFGLDGMIGSAAAWAMLGTLIPASLLAPSCDPGLDFAIFSGVALALRRDVRSWPAASLGPSTGDDTAAPATHAA